MTCQRKDEPDCVPESHWYPSDPAAQPVRDQVLSLYRLVQESRARLGPHADPEDVWRDLNARGLSVSREEVAREWTATA
jgi:hypothetical protein